MSWKDDLTKLVEQNEMFGKQLQDLRERIQVTNQSIAGLKILVEKRAINQDRAADRMADRMIEMAMVKQGSPDMATAHRRTLDESSQEGADLWQDNPETQWPPPGCDAIDMK